jgi:hypothetical protein
VLYLVVEQLVLGILPEDLPWGLAILFSIEDMEALKSVLLHVPATPISLNVLIYFLAVLISKKIDRFETTLKTDPNQVWQQMLKPLLIFIKCVLFAGNQ